MKKIKSTSWLCSLLVLVFAVCGCVGMDSQGRIVPQGLGQSSGSYGQSTYYNQSAYSQSAYSQNAAQANFPLGRPVGFQAFKDRYQSVGRSPEGAVRMYFDAVYSYIDTARRSEGAKMLRYSIHEKQGWENFPSQQTFVSRLRNASYHYIFRSFADGTGPENSYAMNPDNYRLIFAGSRQETDYVALSIRSTGADNPRLLQVQQFEDGLWYVTGYSSTYSDVRQPASQRRTGGHDADRD